MILTLLAVALARPTDNADPWSFADEDVVVSWDSANGLVRVWYSESGPNLVRAGDEDADGVPDFVQLVGATTEDVLAVYADAGFRPPVPDGFGGGSSAMDVYLVDFGGNADGLYSPESCTAGSPRQCSGYFVMENDFTGYGYSDIPTAVKVLTSHELFHAVQAAYDAEEEIWWSEGSAVWAEWLYDPGTEDFLWYADAYLEDTGRSLDQPPSGPVPAFAYATGLWWWFLADRYGDDVMIELLEATEAGDDLLVAMADIQAARGGSLWEDWTTFARWNLATGTRAGAAESYPFAAEIGPALMEDRGDTLAVDRRYYPLAATYFRLDHPGGELWFALEQDAPELYFALHPETDDGKVGEPVAEWAGTATPTSLGELAEGTYFLVGSNATLAEDSTKVLTCLGDPATLAACAPAPDTGDTGDTGGGDGTDDPPPAEGCGCASPTAAPGAWAWLGLALAAARRRR